MSPSIEYATQRQLVDRPRLRVRYERRRSSSPMGRFGGGWDWCAGVEVGRGAGTIMLNLVVASVRIERGDTARRAGLRARRRAAGVDRWWEL